MTGRRFALVLARNERPAHASAAELGRLTGELAAWVSALRRWRLLVMAGPAAEDDAGPVRGLLVVAASDARSARTLADSCSAAAGHRVTVLELDAPHAAAPVPPVPPDGARCAA